MYIHYRYLKHCHRALPNGVQYINLKIKIGVLFRRTGEPNFMKFQMELCLVAFTKEEKDKLKKVEILPTKFRKRTINFSSKVYSTTWKYYVYQISVLEIYQVEGIDKVSNVFWFNSFLSMQEESNVIRNDLTLTVKGSENVLKWYTLLISHIIMYNKSLCPLQSNPIIFF